jgi:hypothetical protein
MPTDRLPYREVRPTWGNIDSRTTVRYAAHPSLRLAFVQVPGDASYVYVVSDEPLPTNFDEALAVVDRWRVEHG